MRSCQNASILSICEAGGSENFKVQQQQLIRLHVYEIQLLIGITKIVQLVFLLISDVQAELQ